MDAEQRVRAAAAALLAAIDEAKAAGLAVQWPSRPEGLVSMAISATAASGAQETTPARAARKRKGKS